MRYIVEIVVKSVQFFGGANLTLWRCRKALRVHLVKRRAVERGAEAIVKLGGPRWDVLPTRAGARLSEFVACEFEGAVRGAAW